MIDQSKNVFIGIFVIGAIALFAYVLSFLHPSVGDGTTILRARFTDIDKVNPGTRVSYAGRPVGEVVEIILIEEGREGRTDRSGRSYMYELVLHVDSTVFVYNTDTVTILTSGLLGERSVGIIPRKPEPDEEVILMNNQVIYASGGASVEEAIGLLQKLAGKAETMLDEIVTLVRDNNEDLNQMLVSARSTMDKMGSTLDRANETDIVGSVKEAADSFETSMNELQKQLKELQERELWAKVSDVAENIRSITESIDKPRKLSETVDNIHMLSERLNVLEGRVEGSWDKVDLTLDEVRVAAENAREITEDGLEVAADAKAFMRSLNSGSGTLGKLIKDDELYLRTTSIMSKAETLMNDVNHYGLLFHLNKQWKRGRTKRASAIAAIDTPREFREYFDEEVDQMNTALSRVNMLLQQADEKGQRDEITSNEAFSDVFADLLRQVQGLEQSLKYYNESLHAPR